MSAALTEADLIFPHQSNTPSFSTTLSSLRRSTLSIHNRLSSIVSDSEFIASVAEAYSLPLVANERCGSWYIPPSLKASSVYFKSTDGHMGEWGFSLRRLNLQLLDVVENWGGAVIVDSTRRGKSMPDALSKTVPIWCCVINRAVFSERSHELFTSPQAVSESEHAQIDKRMEGFVQQFLDICKPNIPHLRSKLQKPLRPLWVTQQSSLPASPPSFPDFHPIVLCTASRRVRGAEASENGYIQGAADDHEAWAHKLTPPLFWANRDLLLHTSEEDVPGIIVKMLSEEQSSSVMPTLIQPTSTLYISPSENVEFAGFDVVISCTPTPLPSLALKNAGIKASQYLHLPCQTGKLGSRDLRAQLPRLLAFFAALPDVAGRKILVCCPTGKDFSVGTALALLCLYVDEQGSLSGEKESTKEIDKSFIKQRLSWITTSNPALNPSRATLQSVNAVLLESRAPKATMTTTKMAYTLPIRTAAAPKTPTKNEHQAPHPNGNENENRNQDKADIPTTLFHTLPSHPWSFTRTLTSTLPTHPSGHVRGTATFTLCPSLPSSLPPTLLYAEEGEFVTDTGLRFSARRKYVYQLKDGISSGGEEDRENGGEEGKYISIRFFADDALPRSSPPTAGVGAKGEAVGSLFVEMGSLVSDGDGVLTARNREQHLCAEDLYTASWKFGRGMMAGKREGEGGKEEGETWWEVRYDVKGPKKDYVSVTRYTLAGHQGVEEQ